MNQEIKLSVHQKEATAYFANGGGAGILVLHAWWGLNSFFKEFCDGLAKEGFTVLAPDLRDGEIATTIDEAKALMEKEIGEYIAGIMIAAKDYLREKVKNKIGVIGFSMGGAWALVLASETPDEIGATVLFYGNEGVDYTKVTSKVMGHYSDNDEWEPNEFVDNTFAEFKKAGVDATLHIYPGVAHWFFESDRLEYDSAAAQLAWDRTIEFLKKNL